MRAPNPVTEKTVLSRAFGLKAEGEGFEPSVQGLPTQRFSRPPRLTTPAPLRGRSRAQLKSLATAPRGEEPDEQGRTLGREHAALDERAMVQARLGENVEHAARGSRLGV